MASRVVSRKVELYTMHAHADGVKSINYATVFSIISNMRAQSRVLDEDDVLIVLARTLPKGERILFELYQGPKGVNPVIFDVNSGNPRIEDLQIGEFLAEKTYALVDPNARRIAVERNQKGVKAEGIAKLVEKLIRISRRGKAEFKNFKIEFVAMVDEEFSEEINQFDRIREASIVVTRPNASWTDHYTSLSSALEDSNGDKAEISVRAGRGESLNRRNGIVSIMKEIVSDAFPYLQRATVKGVRHGESAETTISSTKHIRHSRARVHVDENGHVYESDVYDALEGLLASDADVQT